MLDIEKIRNDFPMLKGKKMQGKDLIYFDNAATTFKPICVLNAIGGYYMDYTSNAHRGDYDLSYKVDTQYDAARENIARFINADKNEIVFTSNDTLALNMVAYGLSEVVLKAGDEVIINEAEHASNVLPWLRLQKEMGIVVKYASLDEKGRITLDAIKKQVTDKTKVISIAHISNVLGYINDVKTIAQYAHSLGIIVIVDGAQSVPHLPIDVKDLDCDFLTFSGHKMCGPTGIGVLYGKYEWLDKIPPLVLGGGMNITFTCDGEYEWKKAPLKFEAGTPLIEGAIGLSEAANYLFSVGMNNIHNYEMKLKKYAIEKLKLLDNVTIYNEESESAIVTFNLKNVFAQDAASFFNYNGIAVRSGEHCAKLLDHYLKTPATVRASFYFYNTTEEIDKFIEVCKRGDDFLDAYF
jgi:cysteine desulfurase/selenocysteine lyase